MDDIVTRFITDLIGRLSGPLTLRLFLQPAVAIILAIVPYVLLRGVINRLARTWIHSHGETSR